MDTKPNFTGPRIMLKFDKNKIMKKIIILFYFALLQQPNLFAGTVPGWAWGHNFNAIVSTMEYSGNYLYTAGCFSNGPFVFGNTNIANNGGKDVIVMKWDTLGNLIWANSIWGSGDDYVVSIKVNNSNEIILVGSSNSASINVGATTLLSNGGYDVYYAKFDLNGNALNAYNYGTVADEYAVDMCSDYQSGVYILTNDKLTKYNTSGIQNWQKNITASVSNLVSELYYSDYDSTILICGSFAGSFTLNNSTLTTQYNNQWGFWPSHIYGAKLAIDGQLKWFNDFTPQVGHSASRPLIYAHKTNGKIYIPYSQNGVGDNYYAFIEVSASGVKLTGNWGGLQTPAGWDMFWGVTSHSIHGKDNYVSIHTDDNPDAFLIYDVSTHTLIKTYDLSLSTANAKSPHIFMGLNSIYTMGNSPNNINYKLGKIDHVGFTGNPSYQNVYVCTGQSVTLTGNVVGGVGPKTYSWLPVTGLNNTNTNSVIFTAVSNISYTLTVTDSLGQIAKDTFNIIVQNVAPTVNITTQYPAICDSMKLYSNTLQPGEWSHYFTPANIWQTLPGYDTILTISKAGKYAFKLYSCFGLFTDTIIVPGVVNVTATSTQDTICVGQAVTFNGSGAPNYIWTDGIIDNVPYIVPVQPISPINKYYYVTGSDANGCTGSSFIKMRIYYAGNSNTNLSICANQTPYNWNGQSLDSSGTYTANIPMNYPNNNPCDSVATLNLTVSPCIVCVPDFTINYSPFYNSLTESQSWIITSGTVLIEAGTQVKLDAHQTSYVTLNPGFKVDSGAVFVAQAYNGCTAGAPQLPQERKIANADLLTNNEIVLYPNPSSGMIHIKHEEKLSNIQIFDMVGKLVINQKCHGETETNIDLSHLPNGVYHVKAAGYNAIKVVKNN